MVQISKRLTAAVRNIDTISRSNLTKRFYVLFFFFNDTGTTEIYSLSLHDALPISDTAGRSRSADPPPRTSARTSSRLAPRSEEHTSELQSRVDISYAVFCLKK